MKKIILTAALLGTFSIAGVAHAGSYQTTISGVGAQGAANGAFYIFPATQPIDNCPIFYWGPSTDLGKAQYSTAMTAYMSGHTVRIDYTPASGSCTLTLIGLQ